MNALWGWILFHTGGDWAPHSTTPTVWYNEPSGFLSCLGLFGTALAVTFHGVSTYRRTNCKRRWCWRIGHHPFTDPATGISRLLCAVHHPDAHHKHLTDELIAVIHERRKMAAAFRPAGERLHDPGEP